MFLAGGSTSSSVVDTYDVETNQWSTTQLPRANVSVLVTKAGERALFANNNGPYNQVSGIIDIYTTNAALPVNLISFSGKWTESVGAELSWQTSRETNNNHFEIQRSPDAKSFETIGRVEGKGTTTERADYSFTDADMPDPINYYRLKQVDFDGSVHFSTIVSVSHQETNQLASLSVWPSPATDKLTLQLSTAKTIRETSIYDLYGRRLSTQVSSKPTADVAGLPSGAYLVDVLTTDGQHLRTRFVKQ